LRGRAREAYFLADVRDKPWDADTLAAAYARKHVFFLASRYQREAVAAFREKEAWKAELADAEKRLEAYDRDQT
jgi:hypothetical protein